MKNILLLDNSVTLNGTAVYYKNLALFLKGHAKVYFLSFKNHIFYNDITSNAHLISWIKLLRVKIEVDVIYACTADTFVTALFLKSYFFKKARIIYSIFHPRQNFFEPHSFGNVYKKIVRKKMIESPESFVFCNEYSKNTHEAYYELNLDKTKVFPVLISALEIPEKSLLTSSKDSSKTRIVSLGRLVDFKCYHEEVIRAIAVLNKTTIKKFEYHIYGGGHLYEKLLKFIKDNHYENIAFLHNSIAPEEIYNCLINADIFIGMGTSLVYAASLGVPSICAVDSITLTFGFFTIDAFKGYEFGEHVMNQTKMTYLSVLQEFLEYDDIKRINLRNKTIEKANEFMFEKRARDLLSLLKSAEYQLSGISIWRYLQVCIAKLGIKFLPKKLGDK